MGDEIQPGLVYDGVAYRYDANVVFLGFIDRTANADGRKFTVWCSVPHRFAVRLDDGRVVEMTVASLTEDGRITYRLGSVRSPA
ncbi:MAG: hypothetical protein IMW98_10430 [Firmicutes bacterium]|nr:hypothetical protein [Bacillota bacterium]